MASLRRWRRECALFHLQSIDPASRLQSAEKRSASDGTALFGIVALRCVAATTIQACAAVYGGIDHHPIADIGRHWPADLPTYDAPVQLPTQIGNSFPHSLDIQRTQFIGPNPLAIRQTDLCECLMFDQSVVAGVPPNTTLASARGGSKRLLIICILRSSHRLRNKHYMTSVWKRVLVLHM